MNWETAKGWLIAAFFILDVILGWQVVQSRNELRGYVESYSDLLANTKTLLADHGFMLATPVPQDQPDLPSFRAQFATPKLGDLWPVCFPQAKGVRLNSQEKTAITEDGRIRVVAPGTWQVTYTNPPSVPSGANLLHFVWDGTRYQFNQEPSMNGTVIYAESYNGYPIFDVALSIQFGENALYGYMQTNIQNIVPAEKPQPIISALDALDNLANTVDKSGDGADNKILRVDLGYAHKIPTAPFKAVSTREDYWFPVWRVLTDGQVYYVNALTGEVETAP